MRTFILALFAVFILGCKSGQTSVAEADKIVSTITGGYHAEVAHGKITVTADAIKVELERDKTVRKTYPFTKKEFAKLLASFKNLKVKGSAEKDGCLDHGNEHLTFYKGGEEIVTAGDYSCDKENRNFSGAEIDLSYLIEDYDELVASLTRKEENNEEDQNKGWTATEKKQYMKECVRMTEAVMGKKTAADSYCSCMMDKLQKAFPTKEAADDGYSSKVAKWVDECSKQ